MFHEIEADLEYYRRAFKSSGQNAHSRFLFEYSFGVVKGCYLKANKKEKLTPRENYMIAHYCHGCVDCLEDWIRSTNRLCAEEMAQLYYEAMPVCLRDTWSIE